MKRNMEDKIELFTEKYFFALENDFPIEFQNIENLTDFWPFLEKHFQGMAAIQAENEIATFALSCYKKDKKALESFFQENAENIY